MLKIKSILILGVVLPMIILPGCHPLEWELERMDPGCPCVQSISPAGAGVGDTVRVSGVNFDSELATRYSLSIGNTIVGIHSMTSTNELLFVVPAQLENGTVAISLDGCDSDKDPCTMGNPMFTYRFKAKSAEVFAGIPNEASIFDSPRGLDVDAEGRVIVADRDNNVIQRVDRNGTVSLLAGEKGQGGQGDHPIGTIARFNLPSDVVVDPNNQRIYVVDEFNHSIRTVEPTGEHQVLTLSGDPGENFGHDDILADARFKRPVGIAIDEDGATLDVTEFTPDRLRRLDISSSNGLVNTVLGTLDGSTSPLKLPMGVAFSSLRTLETPVFVADRDNQKIRSVDPITGNFTDVPPVETSVLSAPSDLVVDDRGNLYVTEQSTNRIYCIDPNNQVVPIAGEGINFAFEQPSGIAIDQERLILYVSDESMHVVVKIELE